MRLLLLSNSTNPGEEYLAYPKNIIRDFLGSRRVNALFLPYAAITISYDEYEQKVKDRFEELGHSVIGIHHFESPKDAVKRAEVIIIGGGNTFRLLQLLQDNELIPIIREKVLAGVPYIGWSAGSNITSPTICTTNDMPVVETKGFKALNLVPFQINPHYQNYKIPNFGGETRDQRIEEFMKVNSDATVIGIPEGTLLRYDESGLKFIGMSPAKIFSANKPAYELNSSDDFDFLMK